MRSIPKDQRVPDGNDEAVDEVVREDVREDVQRAHEGAADFGYPSSPEPKTGGLASRITWFILGALPLAVIATATTLTPATAGHGTHMQLGLPPCGFLVSTGLPCPGCGLTTSFSHMVRFDWAGASSANAFGVALFLVSFFTIPVSFYSMWKGLPVIATMEKLQFEKIVVALAISSSLVWCVRIATILL